MSGDEEDDEGDDIESCLNLVMSETPSEPVCDNPERQLAALQRVFLAVPEKDLRWFVTTATWRHVAAALRQDLTKRQKHTLTIFFRGQGTVASSEFTWEHGARMGGNYTYFQELKNEGFVVTYSGSKRSQDFILSLTRYNTRARRRIPLKKRRSNAVYSYYGEACQRCGSVENLQVDHRIPILAGCFDELNETLFLISDWQPLCGSCNSLKSAACEACSVTDQNKCKDCYWANFKQHTHRAGDPGYWFDGGKLPTEILDFAKEDGVSPYEWVSSLITVEVDRRRSLKVYDENE